MDDVSGVNKMVDWKYTYKKRGWTIQNVIASLQARTYKAFEEWHISKGITCPTEDEYKASLPVEKPKLKPPTPKKRKTRTKRNETTKARKK